MNGWVLAAARIRRGIARAWKNVSATDEYVARVERGDPVAVDLHPHVWPVSISAMRSSPHSGSPTASTRPTSLDALRRGHLGPRTAVNWSFLENGVITRIDGRLRLTRRGMLVANDVMTVFV